jgi:HEAT repeat protein
MDQSEFSKHALLKALGDPDPLTRQNAAFECWRWEGPRDPAVVDALIGALQDTEARVREYSRKALRLITTREGGGDSPEDWAKWWESRGRKLL